MDRANRTTPSRSPRAAPHGDAAEREQRERTRRRHELHLELDEVALIEVVLAKLTEVEHQHVGACDGEHVRQLPCVAATTEAPANDGIVPLRSFSV